MNNQRNLQKTVVSVFVLMGLAMLLTAGTRDGSGFVGVGDALPANIIVVTNTNDSGPGSLRNALAVAHNGDTIDATGISGTILLTSGALQIALSFNNNLLIIGPGAENLAVDGNATFPVFKNFATGATISGFTITNGLSDSNGGGGIQNPGGPSFPVELTVTSCSVVSNTGVGISNFANDTNQDGSSTLTITDSTVSGNSGGGISNIAEAGETLEANAELTVSNCTISGNMATNGGGIYNSAGAPSQHNATANVAISNSTLSSNSAGNGGAIYNLGGAFGFASVTLGNSTLSGNSAGNGGAIYNLGVRFGGAGVTLGNTILNAGVSGGTIFNSGTFTSLGYNLASDNGGGVLTGPGDQINTDPMLGPLQDNGGPTFTHALLPGSPAIDTGDPNFTPPPLYDQRGPGFPRVVDGRIDIGSFEVQAGGTPTPSPTATPTATATASPTPTATARPTPTPRLAPTPRPRPTPAPRP